MVDPSRGRRKPQRPDTGTKSRHAAHHVSAVRPDGGRARLSDMPLVAFALRCGHLGREYGIVAGDLVFCRECGAQRRVSKIIAS